MYWFLFIIGVAAAYLAGMVVGAVLENRLVCKVISNADKLRATRDQEKPYSHGDAERAKYNEPRTMWGPMPKDQGNGSL